MRLRLTGDRPNFKGKNLNERMYSEYENKNLLTRLLRIWGFSGAGKTYSGWSFKAQKLFPQKIYKKG